MMRLARTFAAALRRDERGTMLIETAIVAPALLLLSMGGFQVSQVIARQTELQGAAAEASAIALAAAPETEDQRAALKAVIMDSTGLDADKVSITQKFRCGSATAYVNAATVCVGTRVASYVRIELNDTYTPAWTAWGIGEPFNFNVDRYVMVKQS